MAREVATRVDRRRPARKADATGQGSHKRVLLIGAAVIVGFVLVRKLTGSSTAGATVPVAAADPNALGSIGGGITTPTSGGAALASDGTPAVGQLDLVTALSPFGTQLDNLQAEADATASTLTSALAAAPVAYSGLVDPITVPPAAHTQPAATPAATPKPIAVPASAAPKLGAAITHTQTLKSGAKVYTLATGEKVEQAPGKTPYTIKAAPVKGASKAKLS